MSDCSRCDNLLAYIEGLKGNLENEERLYHEGLDLRARVSRLEKKNEQACARVTELERLINEAARFAYRDGSTTLVGSADWDALLLAVPLPLTQGRKTGHAVPSVSERDKEIRAFNAESARTGSSAFVDPRASDACSHHAVRTATETCVDCGVPMVQDETGDYVPRTNEPRPRKLSPIEEELADHQACFPHSDETLPFISGIEECSDNALPRRAGVPAGAHKPEYMQNAKAFVEAYCDGSVGDDEEDIEDVVFELESMMAKAYADGHDEERARRKACSETASRPLGATVEGRLVVTNLCDMRAFYKRPGFDGTGRLVEILESAINLIEGRDCFAPMPTGGTDGK